MPISQLIFTCKIRLRYAAENEPSEVSLFREPRRVLNGIVRGHCPLLLGTSDQCFSAVASLFPHPNKKDTFSLYVVMHFPFQLRSITSSCPSGAFFRYSHFWLLYGFRIGIGSVIYSLRSANEIQTFERISRRNERIIYHDLEWFSTRGLPKDERVHLRSELPEERKPRNGPVHGDPPHRLGRGQGSDSYGPWAARLPPREPRARLGLGLF